MLGAGSGTRADGASGGQVWLETTAGRTSVHGTRVGRRVASAGGRLRVLGRGVGLFDGARSALPARRSGLVHIGGGDRGQEASLPNARALYAMAPGAGGAADSPQQGDDGGPDPLERPVHARLRLSLSARGGPRAARAAG